MTYHYPTLFRSMEERRYIKEKKVDTKRNKEISTQIREGDTVWKRRLRFFI